MELSDVEFIGEHELPTEDFQRIKTHNKIPDFGERNLHNVGLEKLAVRAYVREMEKLLSIQRSGNVCFIVPESEAGSDVVVYANGEVFGDELAYFATS